VLFNAHDGAIPFTLPAGTRACVAVLDTARDGEDLPREAYGGGAVYPLEARSVVLLREASRP
jgi:hypothetical protein